LFSVEEGWEGGGLFVRQVDTSLLFILLLLSSTIGALPDVVVSAHHDEAARKTTGAKFIFVLFIIISILIELPGRSLLP
jgi:hypothetical protein